MFTLHKTFPNLFVTKNIFQFTVATLSHSTALMDICSTTSNLLQVLNLSGMKKLDRSKFKFVNFIY